jgi:hypothetical protein
MPSTSKKQHNFMAAVANNPKFAKKAGVPQSVGKDFNEADKGRKFSKGGDMATKMNPAFKAMIEKKKAGANPAAKTMPMKAGGATKKMMGGGMAYAKGGSASARADGVATKGKTKGKMLNKGGMAC